MLECIDKDLIDTLSLVVTSILLPGLLLESLPLVKWIVQLGVGVANLLGGNKDFETLAETIDVSVSLGQGTHDLWVTDDEGGVDALRLDELADQLVDQASRSSGL